MEGVIHSVFVSRGAEAFRYRLSDRDHDAFDELLTYYSPIGGPVRKVATYLGPGGGFGVSVGHSAYYDLDRIFQRLANTPSLDTGSTKSLFGGGKVVHAFRHVRLQPRRGC